MVHYSYGYLSDGYSGVPLPAGQARLTKATQTVSFVRNNRRVEEGQVILAVTDRSVGDISVGATRVAV